MLLFFFLSSKKSKIKALQSCIWRSYICRSFYKLHLRDFIQFIFSFHDSSFNQTTSLFTLHHHPCANPEPLLGQSHHCPWQWQPYEPFKSQPHDWDVEPKRSCIHLHSSNIIQLSWLVNLPPPNVPPPEIRVLIAGLIKGSQWLISPDHKALFLGGVR